MRKLVKITGFALAILILTIVKSHAQVLSDVQDNFNRYNLNAPQEKIYAHTDKNAYTAGEFLWLKLYYVDGINNHAAGLSKVAYVEILDKNQNPVIQAKIALDNGSGSGSIYIPVNLSSGNYVLRAYTNWMKNFNPDYYFYKQLTIINPLKSPDLQAKNLTPDYDVQFFPEGGNLVNGISSIVGFKGTDQWGRGIYFKGAILDNNNDTVARFEPYKFGIGRFTFKPDNHISYRAVIKIGSKLIEKKLPQIYDTGYVMSLTDNGSGQLLVTVNTDLPATDVYLFVHTRGEIKKVGSAVVNNGTAQFTIDKTIPGDGVTHITVFNSDKQPVCERLYFKRPTAKLLVDASTDQQQYSTRKKVSISIGTKDQDSNAVVANLSLSVYRLDSLQHTSQDDIRSYLWLSADLKGIIESPGYYFNNVNAEADLAIDNLMLTQGWRKFNWGDVLKTKAPVFSFLPEYNGPIITAKLTNQLTNKPEKNIIAYLAIPGKKVQMYTAVSDSLGQLIFNMADFFGPGEIVLQNNTLKDTIYHMDVLNPFSEQYAQFPISPFTITAGLQPAMENINFTTQVQNIYSGNKLRQFYDTGMDSSAFYGIPYKKYLLDNYTRFLTMEEVLREYVTEVNILHSKDGFHIKVLNENGFLGEGDPMVIIDGVPFFNANKLFAVDPLKIRKLEDVPFTYHWGPSVEDGIFSFTSYKGDLAGAEIDPHAVVLDYDGLEMQRVFYSPVYDTGPAYSSRMPDFRNVLYWAPFVITSTQAKNGISFYTSDQTGKYIGVIQGITADGIAGSQYFSFGVSK
jgi:hypothetical protein